MDPVIDRPPVAPSLARQALRRSLDALAGNALDTALAEAEAALQAEPDSALACHVLGLAALRLGRLATAIDLFARAHRADPQTREHADALAIGYAAAGRVVDSLYYGKLALALTPSAAFPDLLPAWLGGFADHFRAMHDAPLLARGTALLAAGRPRQAAVLFQQEAELDRNSAPAWRGLARASLAAHDSAGAAVAAEALCAVEPDDAANVALLGRALSAAGQHADAAECQRRAGTIDDAPAYRAGLIAALAADPALPRAALAAAIIAAAPSSAMPPRTTAPPDAAGRPLRVGLLSGRWRTGAGLDLLVPLIEQRDRADWHAFLYVDDDGDDPQLRRLRNAATAVIEIADIDDETAVLLIGNDGLDLLIDFDLHQPGWRGGLVAARPAPLMLGWLGLPETAAALGYDAMLGDRWTHGHPIRGDAQPTVSVPGGMLCLRADDAAPVPPMEQMDEAPVFTTPASRAQITDEAVALWAELLEAVPAARLRLDPQILGGGAAAAGLHALFGERGVAERVEIGVAGTVGHGSMVLDPPGGGMSPEAALAALRAGVPVVTLPGAIPARRMVASLLGGLDLDGLVAGDTREYIAIAASLAAPAPRAVAAAQIARALDRPPMLAPAARAAVLAAALRGFVVQCGGRA